MELLGLWVDRINSVLWSTPLVVLCLGAGIFLSVRLRFPQFRHFKRMIKLTVSGEKSDAGITPFQAFAATVGSRVGMGNIAGVATAIFMGGPGAIFWMWVITLFGAASAFVESTLGQAYKTTIPSSGEYVGGPAYYIERGLKKKGFAIVFALSAIIGPGITMPGLQAQQLAAVFHGSFGTSEVIVGVVLTVCIALVVFGGVKRIGKIAELISPFMCVVYVLLALIVMILRFTEIPAVFALIFKSAFGMQETFAGIVGSMISWGVKRGVYSNEAGQGSGAIVSSATETSHPAKQGLVQVFSVYVDSIIICTASALIILLSGFYNVQSTDGTLLIQQAGDVPYGILYVQEGLNRVLTGNWSGALFSIAVILFVFSSLLGYYYEAESNVTYISDGNRGFVFCFRIIFLIAVFTGVLINGETLWSMADIGVGLMAWANIIAILFLSRKALDIMRDFESQTRLGVDPCFDPRDFNIEDRTGTWNKYAKIKRARKTEEKEPSECK